MKVYYMNGAGNDFMVIDGRGLTADYAAWAKELCALRGADGFMAVDSSDIADFRLHFYNSDGSRGEMCGNGARCICRFAHDLGLAGETMTVQTDAGLVSGWHLSGEQYRIRLNTPTVAELNRVEDFTLACGTGCGSVAAALWLQGRLPGGELALQNRGGTLRVRVEGRDGRVTALYQEGPTEITEILDWEP